MRKKIIQDVVSNKRSIQDISIPKRSQRPSFDIKPKKLSEDEYKNTSDSFIDARNRIQREEKPKKNYNFEYDFDKPEKESRKTLWFAIFVFIVALLFGISSLFSKATVSVITKKDNIPIKETFRATKNPKTDEFGYQVITLESSVKKEKIEGGLSEQKVEEKASGVLIVTNNSGKPQKLIENTRFESPKGLIYRIKNAVTLPVSKTEVTVYADLAGEEYNLAKDTNFTIPGLKNDPRYKTIYAVAKDDIKGGFKGTQKTLDENTKKTMNIEFSAELKKLLIEQINTQTPQNFIYYPNTAKYQFEDLTLLKQGDTYTAEKKGKVEIVIFDKKALSKEIIDNLKQKNNIVTPAEVKNLQDLLVDISVDKTDDSFLDFQITGDVSIRSTFDAILLKNDLLGIKKSVINDLLSSKYPGIQEAKVKIFPFWKTTVPLKLEKIEVKEVTSI